MKIIGYILAAIAASLVGFLIHVLTQEGLNSWIGSQMQGMQIKPSFNVVYLAAFTSIEYGIGMVLFYSLTRSKLTNLSIPLRGLLMGCIILMLKGSLLRQPLMNFAVGNPPKVVLVQDGITWVIWFLSAMVMVYIYEFFHKPRLA